MVPSLTAKGHWPAWMAQMAIAAITSAASPGPASSSQAAARIIQGNKENSAGWKGLWKMAIQETERQPNRIGPIKASRLPFQSFHPARADSRRGITAGASISKPKTSCNHRPLQETNHFEGGKPSANHRVSVPALAPNIGVNNATRAAPARISKYPNCLRSRSMEDIIHTPARASKTFPTAKPAAAGQGYWARLTSQPAIRIDGQYCFPHNINAAHATPDASQTGAPMPADNSMLSLRLAA